MRKQIKDYPLYEIDDKGNVYSYWKFKATNCKNPQDRISNTPRLIKQIYDKSCGYMIVTLTKINSDGVTTSRQNKRVHRLLMETFVTNPDPIKYTQINHIDANKLNNNLSNLEWCTPKHNAQHALNLGLYQPQIDKTSKSIIQMDNDFNFIKEYPSIHEAGRQTGIAWQNISKVCLNLRPRAGGYRWKYK